MSDAETTKPCERTEWCGKCDYVPKGQEQEICGSCGGFRPGSEPEGYDPEQAKPGFKQTHTVKMFGATLTITAEVLMEQPTINGRMERIVTFDTKAEGRDTSSAGCSVKVEFDA